MPTPYLPKDGKCTPDFIHSSKKNSCGTCNIMPAPSPELVSQPHAPRCSIFSNTVNASAIWRCDFVPFMLATKPIPQESCSNEGSYRPPPGLPPSPEGELFNRYDFFACIYILL